MKKGLLQLFLLLSINTAIAQPVGPWTNTGPLAFPTNVSGQIHGIGRVSQMKFHPTDPNKIYAVSASGGLYISNNNGVAWAPTTGTEVLPTTNCSSVCIDFTDDNILYLCLGDADYYSTDYGIWKSTDGGATWAAANTGIGNRMAVEILMDPTNHDVLVAATNNGIYKTINGGTTWTASNLSTGSFRDMKAKPGSNNILYACTATNFYYSNDFGSTWTAATSGVTPPGGNGGMRMAVSNNDPQRVYLLTTGGNGMVMRSNDGGLNFTTVYNSSTQCLVCYDGSPTSGSQGNYNIDINANPVNANELIAIAHCVWRSTDGGATWSKRTSWWNEVHTDMHQVEWNPYNNSQLFQANDGGIWLSTDPVATVWSQRSDGLSATEIYRAAQSPLIKQMVSIGTQDNGELYFDGIWKTNRGGDWFSRCWFDYLPNARVYYMDQGERRALQPLGGDQSFNSPIAASNNNFMEFTPVQTSLAFIGQSTIWRSTNINTGTPTWTQISTNATQVRGIASCRADVNTLYVLNSGNQLLRSDNALAATPTFTTLATPAGTGTTGSVATNANDANIVYVSCGNTIWRSTDKGANWTNITSNLPSINIRKVIHDDQSTNERLFVSMGAYVYYKDNSSTTWTNAAGLPSVANYTDFMIFNDGTVNSILRLSTFGRGVWEAGINLNLPPVADFYADKTIVCPGDTVRYYKTIIGSVNSFSWNFPGGTPSTSTLDTPIIVYNTVGLYDATLTAVGTNGTDVETKTNYINVSVGQGTDVVEGFEGVTYPPTNWQLLSESGTNWASYTGAGGFGTSTKSIRFDNYAVNTGGDHDAIIAPKVDLTNTNNARVTFDVAHAPYSSTYPDSLRVLVSTDCGDTYTPVYAKSGSVLATAPNYTAGIFVPTAAQWRKDTVWLTSFVGNPVLVKFENIGYYGQSIYLDNVNIAIGPLAKFGVNDTAICTGGSVQFTDSSSGITSRLWSFPGGTPSTSTIANPTVTYNTAGTYPVTLVVTNNMGNDTLIKTSYIDVYNVPVVSISAGGPTSFCLGNFVTLTANISSGVTYQWRNGGVNIAGATSSTYNATATGTYDVIVTNLGGCSDTSNVISTTVNVGPTATITPAGPLSFCPGGSVVLNANTGTGYTYQWLLNTVNITGATSSSYTATASGSYTVMVSSGACPGLSAAAVVNVNAAPVATASGNTPVCTGGTLQLTGMSTILGSTYSWTGPNSFASALSNPTIANAQPVNGGTYTLIITSPQGCKDTAVTTAVIGGSLLPTPGAITGNTTVCSGNAVTYFVPLDVNATSYTWTLPGGWSGTSATNTIVATPTSAGGTISVVANNACGSSTAQMLAVTSSLSPNTPNVLGSIVYCQNDVAAQLTATGTNLLWYNVLTGGVGSPIAPTPQTTITGTIPYYVSQTVGQCESQRSIILVTVNAPPTPGITQAGNVLSVTGTFAFYQWYLNGVAIPGETASTYTIVQNGTYTCAVSDINGCSAESNSIVFGLEVGTIASKNGLILYPNPNNGQFNLSGIVKMKDGKAAVRILDVTGKVIATDKLKAENNMIDKQITIGDVPAGNYLLILNAGGQNVAIPFTKK